MARLDVTMQSNTNRRVKGPKQKADIAVRPSIRIGAGLAVIACLVLVASGLQLVRAPKLGSASGLVSHSALIQGDAPTNREASANFQNGKGPADVRAGPSGVQPEPTPETRRLVGSLVHLEILGGAPTQEQAAAWKQNLHELVEQGATGVAAIEEFLAQNTEYNFGPGARDLLGYGSARTALLDALAQIGGPEGVKALTAVLQTTADPREIAFLAQDLDKLEPGQHHQEALDAARQTLEMASARKLEMPDVAPLFEVLQKYGGPGVVADLARATDQWNYYGAIALAQLPEDAGIPSLVQLVQDPKTSGSVRDAALQMLAEVSDRAPDARAALLATARMNQMSQFTWQMVASVLAGDQVGLLNSAFEDHQALAQINGLRTVATSDNQNFFALPGSLTAEQANQRIALIDELLSGAGDPLVKELLQQSRISLSKRL